MLSVMHAGLSGHAVPLALILGRPFIHVTNNGLKPVSGLRLFLSLALSLFQILHKCRCSIRPRQQTTASSRPWPSGLSQAQPGPDRVVISCGYHEHQHWIIPHNILSKTINLNEVSLHVTKNCYIFPNIVAACFANSKLVVDESRPPTFLMPCD